MQPNEGKKLVVRLLKTKRTLRMVRFDIPGGQRDTMPNAYVSQMALTETFGHLPDRVRITIEEDK